jgi:hypothetical protein
MAAIMPAGWALELEGDILWVTATQGRIAGSSAPWLISDVLLEEEAVDGGTGSLNLVQQEIAEHTTEPWPATSGPGYRGFPEPGGALVGNELHLWFGDRADPELRLEPIDLAGVILRE